jgi:hypothetical protein
MSLLQEQTADSYRTSLGGGNSQRQTITIERLDCLMLRKEIKQEDFFHKRFLKEEER